MEDPRPMRKPIYTEFLFLITSLVSAFAFVII
jgi:hypothetical protein